jgi:hypothetical protein
MTTVAQMIEWMKTLPQDAEVQCGVEVSTDYQTYMEMKPVQIEYCSVFDYSSPEDHERYPMMNGRVIVDICGD